MELLLKPHGKCTTPIATRQGLCIHSRSEHLRKSLRITLKSIVSVLAWKTAVGSEASILDSYPQYEQRLNEEQRRVLKAVLMMQAVSRRINNAISLLRPTENNIKLAFEGDDSFSTSPALILKNQLVTQLKILFASPAENNVVEYATAMVQGDQQKIDEIIARIRNEAKTGKIGRAHV